VRTDRGFLVSLSVQLTRGGGFGVGGLCEVVCDVARTKVPLRAFWKAARRISDDPRHACDLVVDIQHEFDFYVDKACHLPSAITPTFYGLVEVPLQLMDRASTMYALALERLMPLGDCFEGDGFVRRGDAPLIRQFISSYVRGAGSILRHNISHGDMKVGNVLVRFAVPTGPVTFKRKKRKRFFGVRHRSLDAVFCDWGSWASSNEPRSSRARGTPFYRTHEWFGKNVPAGIVSGDGFGVMMTILCVLAGHRLRLSKDRKSVSAFGRAFVKSAHKSWVSWWFEPEAMQHAGELGCKGLLQFVAGLRSRAGNCNGMKSVLETIEKHYTCEQLFKSADAIAEAELWSEFGV
jgi:hypothetical protein